MPAGIGAVLLPAVLLTRRLNVLGRIAGGAWAVSGLTFSAAGALTYLTHIRLIISTT